MSGTNDNDTIELVQGDRKTHALLCAVKSHRARGEEGKTGGRAAEYVEELRELEDEIADAYWDREGDE